jgi:hypothetical protein
MTMTGVGLIHALFDVNFGTADFTDVIRGCQRQCCVVGILPIMRVAEMIDGAADLPFRGTLGCLLQESTNLTTNVWMNASSGSTNPITLPAIQDAMLYRVVNP